MRLARPLLVVPFVLLWGCTETPRCVDFNDDGEHTLNCNAGKVPVCGDDPEQLYSARTGALLPVPPEGETCEGRDRCRPRPTCNGETVVCPNDLPAQCVLGTLSEITPVTPTPDSGPPPDVDGGPDDEDAGAEDAGPEDAGPEDAGPEDAGSDAGTDSGPGGGGGGGGGGG